VDLRADNEASIKEGGGSAFPVTDGKWTMMYDQQMILTFGETQLVANFKYELKDKTT
jgi:hypothetical protein